MLSLNKKIACEIFLPLVQFNINLYFNVLPLLAQGPPETAFPAKHLDNNRGITALKRRQATGQVGRLRAILAELGQLSVLGSIKT